MASTGRHMNSDYLDWRPSPTKFDAASPRTCGACARVLARNECARQKKAQPCRPKQTVGQNQSIKADKKLSRETQRATCGGFGARRLADCDDCGDGNCGRQAATLVL